MLEIIISLLEAQEMSGQPGKQRWREGGETERETERETEKERDSQGKQNKACCGSREGNVGDPERRGSGRTAVIGTVGSGSLEPGVWTASCWAGERHPPAAL